MAIPFAGLAPDERGARGAGEIVAFDLQGALALGQDLRRLCRTARATCDVATSAVDVLNSFDHDQRPACVLVLAAIARAVRDPPPQLRTASRGITPPPPLCLQMLASRGIEPAWNEVAGSPHDPEMLLVDEAGSVLGELARQLRHQDAARPPVTTFLIPEPQVWPAISDKDFLTSYDVRCIFGFSASVSDVHTMVVIGFCRTALELRAVRLFEVVASYARVEWLSTAEMRSALGADSNSALVAALEDMVRLQERLTGDAIAEYRRNAVELRRSAQREAEMSASAAQQQARYLSRLQRAMLNVIDDLRQARESLAATVELRTAELAAANRKLEARNRELEEFVYIASHDLQEPLRTVGGYLQLVQRRYKDALGVDADEFIRYAIEGAQRMNALIESLLVYSRLTSSERARETVSLEDALTLAKRNLALSIEETGTIVECHTPLPSVRADRIQFVQLFQNLLSNSIKFCGPRAPRIHITCSTREDMHVLEFRDEGIGFNPRFAERIFKIFRWLRRDTPGTGIGLSVCKKIVEAHGGTISAAARPNEGATFTICLPTSGTTEV